MADHEVESEVWMCVEPWSFYLNEQRHDASDHNEAGMCRQDQFCLNSLFLSMQIVVTATEDVL